MKRRAPIFVVRATPRDDVRETFLRWFRTVHLRDARRIPGVAEVSMGLTPAGTVLGVYSFQSADVVRPALESPQAAYARGTWEQWAPHLLDLVLEMYAVVEVSPLELSPN